MKKIKHLFAGMLTGVMVLTAVTTGYAASAHYNDSSVTGSSEAWTAWTEKWKTVSEDFTNVSLTPGSDETQLNFAWYSKDDGTATPVVHFGSDQNNLEKFSGTSASVDASLTGSQKYVWNHVTVTGLKENTTYYYTVEKDGEQTPVRTYKTGNFEKLSILYVGDPQIGASKGQTQEGSKLVAGSGAANTAARSDSFAWNRTLSIATAQNPDLNFVISAGDQVNKTGSPKEEEYAGYLSPDALSSLPVATTIGNHDSLNPDYSYHFNNPNTTGNGKTAAGGDYYYSYGSALFIVLNTNNYNAAEHEKTVQQAVAANPDAKWRIVTIHQDIYGSGLDHSDTDGMILRTQLTPIFDRYDIDVVLQGHDHTYSRSKLLSSDGQTHGTYEFQLNKEGTDYDWDNAVNTGTGSKIALYPDAADTAGQNALTAFRQDNKCYTADTAAGNSVTNPAGTLYMTANSASGSKYSELATTQQDYIADRIQNWLPSYSVISLTDASFSIETYQITDSGKTEQLDATFTISKTGSQAETGFSDVKSTDWYAGADSYVTENKLLLGTSSDTFDPQLNMARAMFVTGLYRMSGNAAVSGSAGFSDVKSGSWYEKAVTWAVANKLVNGYDDSHFGPDKDVTREQAMAILYRYAEMKNANLKYSENALDRFTDSADVSGFASTALKWAAGNGIISGNGLGRLNPGSTATRAEIAKIFMNAASVIK